MTDQFFDDLGGELLQKIAIAASGCLYSLVHRVDGYVAFTYISPYVQEIYELTVEAVMADASLVLKQIHPDDIADCIAMVEQSRETLQPFSHEHRIITPSGKLKWVQASSRPERLSNQETVWYGMALDVTAQKQTEADKFRLSFDNANIGMCLVDLQGNFLRVNEKMCQIFGYSSSEMIKMNVGTLAIPEDNLISQEFIQGAVETHKDSVIFEKRYRHKLGHIIYGEVSSSLVRDAHGTPLYFISQVQDITNRKLHEQELRKAHDVIAQNNIELERRVSERTSDLQKRQEDLSQNEKILRRYFEQHIVGMAMTSPSKRWLNVNKRLCEILGYSFAELQELTWDKITYPDDLALDLEHFNRVISGEIEDYEIDKRFIHKRGQIIHTNLSVQGHRKPDGSIDFFVVLIQDISDRKQAELALQESQNFLQQIADASPHIIYIYDLQEQRNIYVNREIGTILGYRPAEIQAMGSAFFAMLMHPEDLQNIQTEYEQLARAVDGKVYDYEYRMRNTQGEWRWLYSRHSVFSRDAEGRVKYTIGSAQDITDRKLAEQENQRLKERLQFILSSNPAVIFTCTADRSNTVTFISDNVQKVLGYSAAEVLSSPNFWVEHLHPEDIPQAVEGVTKLFEQGYNINEYRSLHRDGNYRWLRNELRLMHDAQGNPSEIVGYFTDVGDRKKAEIALQESQEFLQKVADASPSILYIYDIQENRNVYVNGEVKAIMGYTPTEILEMGSAFFANVLKPEDLSQFLAEHERLQLLQDGEIYNAEYYMKTAWGEWRWFFTRFTVFSRDAKGRVKCTIASAQDITARKLAEVQLQQTYEELVHATRLKDEFLAAMSHELRTPLNAILGMTESLQEEIYGSVNERQIKALTTIESSGLHLLELINDVLDVAKIESGQMHLELTPVSIHSLCESSLVFIQQQALKKKIQVQTILPPQLPPIYLDERRIRQALINLLNNAVKFTQLNGQVTLEVLWIRASPNSKDYLRIVVRDTGIGIAPESIPKLFQPFIQIDSALNRRYEGTGLGLALVKRIVEMHGGEVGVTSEVGVGSCFIVNLPCFQ
ncbi:PAS domain S-box protein [Pseudanabaena sp. ABRG5-3]|uniref:PAS domain S-box protein n=1 Tax=Pseudanabaena sp. ABRG5-3 TaxID=685565 RepID=UPI000DC6D272|nr:PAS domain S-box protein [Pseudanabaena sp. ABRG5-3]BBC23752.1 sensory transduction histidine kinase [Pseudanabaena sp. ABRG5-3]